MFLAAVKLYNMTVFVRAAKKHRSNDVKKFCPFYGGKTNGICYNIFCDSTVKGD